MCASRSRPRTPGCAMPSRKAKCSGVTWQPMTGRHNTYAVNARERQGDRSPLGIRFVQGGVLIIGEPTMTEHVPASVSVYPSKLPADYGRPCASAGSCRSACDIHAYGRVPPGCGRRAATEQRSAPSCEMQDVEEDARARRAQLLRVDRATASSDITRMPRASGARGA
jgi:hypothetical protein